MFQLQELILNVEIHFVNMKHNCQLSVLVDFLTLPCVQYLDILFEYVPIQRVYVLHKDLLHKAAKIHMLILDSLKHTTHHNQLEKKKNQTRKKIKTSQIKTFTWERKNNYMKNKNNKYYTIIFFW